LEDYIYNIIYPPFLLISIIISVPTDTETHLFCTQTELSLQLARCY